MSQPDLFGGSAPVAPPRRAGKPRKKSPATAALAPVEAPPPAPPATLERTPRNPRLSIPQISVPERVVYHSFKHAEFIKCREQLKKAHEAYEKNTDVHKGPRLAEAIQGFQRNLLEMAESLEKSLDPVKMALAIDHLLAESTETFIYAVADEMERLLKQVVALDVANVAAHRRNFTEAFRRIGTHSSVSHSTLRTQLGSLTGAKK